MITRIQGKLIEKKPTYIVIDVSGLGYEIFISTQTFYHLPEIEKDICLYVQTIIREDAHSLFGFLSEKEREVFRLLIKVSGIGAKTALSILSVLTCEEFAMTIENKNIRILSSVPGIGKKTAERIILELKDKMITSNAQNQEMSPLSRANDFENDIINTLIALGYNSKDAIAATRKLENIGSISEGVKIALKNLSK